MSSSWSPPTTPKVHALEADRRARTLCADIAASQAISAVCLLFTYVAFKEPNRKTTNVPLKAKLVSLDPIGTCLILASMTCLVLALQWGGAVLPWNDSRVWGTLLGFGLLLVLFLLLQVRQKEK